MDPVNNAPPIPTQPPLSNPQVIPVQANINLPPSQGNTPKRPAVLTYFVIADVVLYGIAFSALILLAPKLITFIGPLALFFFVCEFFFWMGKKWAWAIRQMFLGLTAAGGFPVGTAYYVIGQLILKKQDVKDYFGSGPKLIYSFLGLVIPILAVLGIFLWIRYSA